jgi:hypothetical protein
MRRSVWNLIPVRMALTLSFKAHMILRPRLILSIASLLLVLIGCAPQFYYHFPKENELRGIRADSLKWRYAANSVVQVPVASDEGKLYWLDVTPKTKLEIKATDGVIYRFYLQSIHIENDQDGILGTSAIWTGYDLLEHVRRSVFAREILTLTVISPEGATKHILQ